MTFNWVLEDICDSTFYRVSHMYAVRTYFYCWYNYLNSSSEKDDGFIDVSFKRCSLI